MNLKLLFFILSIYMFTNSAALPALTIVEDDSSVTTTKTWGEISLNTQRLLIRYFDNMLTQELEKLGVPSFWNHEAERTLLGDQTHFNNIVSGTHSQAKTYAANQKITLDDLLPTGFLMGLGVTGSSATITGMGGSALLTLIVVPLEVEVLNKTTGLINTTYEASWAIGGIGQGGIGTGVGGGIAVRGALGLIWGHLPDAGLLQGTAIGVGGSITAIAGIGFKAAILFNSAQTANGTIQNTNLIALATYDMGLEVNATVEAEMFYFLDQDQILEFISNKALPTSGISKINAAELQKAYSS